ncbi:ArnT family glycosyltransferase, partial [Kaarinaea lacus]
MTSLSIKSNNAIKSLPGEGQYEVDHASDNLSQEHDTGFDHQVRFLSNNHLSQVASHIRQPELVLVFIISLCTFFGLLSLRFYDDNKLTSWHWLFNQADLLMVSSYLVAGLLAALLFINRTFSRHQALSLLLLLSFALSMSHWGNPEVIVDAGRYFSQAKYLEIYGLGYFFEQWGRGIMAWTDMPLLPLVYGLVFKIAGESRLGIQLVNTALFTATIFLTYLLGKQLWNSKVGLYGATMLLSMPYLHTQVSLMMVDVPAMFFLTLAVFLFSRAISKGGNGSMALAAIAIVLAMLAKYSNWLMLSVLPVISGIAYYSSANTTDKTQVLKRSGMIFALFILFAVIPLLWGHEVFVRQIELLLTYQLAIIDGWTESHLSTFIYQLHPFIAILAIFSLFLAYKRKDSRILIVSWMLFLVFVLDIERIRYVLIVFPMLALMAGYAISHLNSRIFRRYLALSILVTASTVSVMGHASFLSQTSAVNLQSAANDINNLDYPGVEIIVLEQQNSSVNPLISVPLLDLYLQKPVIPTNVDRRGSKLLSKEQLKSTLRFTWEYRIPDYYQPGNQKDKNIIAVISSYENQEIPANVSQHLTGYNKTQT